jgi:hypothetical protein
VAVRLPLSLALSKPIGQQPQHRRVIREAEVSSAASMFSRRGRAGYLQVDQPTIPSAQVYTDVAGTRSEPNSAQGRGSSAAARGR